MRRLFFGGAAIALGTVAMVELFACDANVDICFGSECPSSDGGDDADGQIVPTGCDLTKDPKDSAACVDDTIGIFVSASGADSNSGTKSSPMKTIGAALDKISSQHSRIYVCEGTYPETVKVTKAVGIFGGFACADWSYSGKLPKVGPTAPGYALDVESVTGAVIAEDLELDAPNATEPGGSSIAVFLTQSTNVMLKRVTANAGNGADGADAVATSNYDAGAAPAGNNAPNDNGGVPCVNICGDGTRSIGGSGGTGQNTGTTSGAGADGGPTIPPNPAGFDGIGGAGKLAGCNTGDPGATAGAADAGSSGGRVAGTCQSSGWTPSLGSFGFAGGPGQGGGGGSGGTHAIGLNTGGGGGGGCGGCGGAGGAGGGSGGSSFAILAFQTALSLDTCTLHSGSGATGKIGGGGQHGQGGGIPGAGVPLIDGGTGCNGGAGGAGGDGAGGGGGAGGNSIAIGYVGTKPTVTGGTMSEGNAGAHGAGGAGAAGNDGLPGADGIKADMQELQ